MSTTNLVILPHLLQILSKCGTQLTTPHSDQSKKPTSSSAESIVSKFLGGVPVKTPSRPANSKSSGARVLTSAECIALLEEKQEKKEKEKEEKEQRKLVRDINKKKREEQKKKAEERAK